MFLENVYKELIDLQEPYNGILTLTKLGEIDISNIEGRVELLINIMKLRTSLGIKYFLNVNENLSERQIKEILATADNYSSNMTIVRGCLANILQGVGYEIEKVNGGEHDYELIKKICNGESDVSAFVNTLNGVNIKNKVTIKKGLSGKIYTLKLNGLALFNTEELKDILLGKDGIEGYDDIIEFVLNDNNFKFIKERYNNLRMGLMSVLKEIINPEDKSKLIEAIKENNLIKQSDTKETNIVNN